MTNCVIAFRRTASDFCGDADSVISALNRCGIVVADVLYFSGCQNLKNFMPELCALYQNVFILNGTDFDVSLCLDLNGVYTQKGGTAFFLLPSDTQSAVRLIEESVVKTVYAHSGERFGKITVKAFCTDVLKIDAAVKEARAAADGRLIIYVNERHFDFFIEIIYNHLTPKFVTDEVLRILNTRLFEYVYSLDGKSLSLCLFELLSVRKHVLSAAESFTGGGISKSLIEVPGASKVFFEGITAYSDKSKTGRLGVSQTTLNTVGAVSDQTAYEMALGLLEGGNCTLAVSTTGIAGPGAEGTDKPTGLCYIAVGNASGIEVFKYHFGGDRESVTLKAVNAAVFRLIKKIK